jgi:hypothetical protein
MADHLLFESSMGYSLYKTVHKGDAVGNRLKEVQDSVQDLAKFGKMVELVGFLPFEYVYACKPYRKTGATNDFDQIRQASTGGASRCL